MGEPSSIDYCPPIRHNCAASAFLTTWANSRRRPSRPSRRKSHKCWCATGASIPPPSSTTPPISSPTSTLVPRLKSPSAARTRRGVIDLRQVSLGLLVSRDFHVPLFHEIYPGNRPDAVEFGVVLKKLRTRYAEVFAQPHNITLVFDKGNNSAENFRLLDKSGKAMARTGLRMMPTFPSPPLKFRTAGFPQYGFKAGLSEGAFPARRPIVAPIWFTALLRAPRFQPVRPRSVSGQLCAGAPPCQRLPSLYPRGPRSGPGYSVPVLLRLIDPIRPSCRHISTSPHCGLYEMPSRCMFLYA